ncbi:hypothetical protein Tco_1222838 [Tanacetum coccineum]
MEDTDNAHIPKVSTTTWFKPIPERERPATPEPEWTILSNDFPEPEHNWANAYATTFKVPEENKLQRKTYDIGSVFLQYQMDECHKLLTNKVDLSNPALPLGGPPGQEFYINKHSEPSDREAVRYNYGYNYLREIILRRADYQEYKISEKDFRNLHPNDFEDLFLLNIQEKLNHLPKTDKTSLHTTVNMWIRNLDAADYYFKEDYTIVPKPRAVVYRDRNDQRKLMRLNELHKFSDGTLTRVMEKLDHMVKDFHLFEYNKGMETRKWSEDDKRRSKDFITAIEKRLQIRRIYRSLESFVGGRIRDIDYRLINRTTHNSEGFYPGDNPIVSVEVLSHEVSVSTERGCRIKRNVKIKGVKKEASIRLANHEETKTPLSIRLSHSELVDIEQVAVSSRLRFTRSKSTIELDFERPHKGVKASANSDVMYFFTSAQDGDQLQDDVRLCLGDDLKKAQDHKKGAASIARQIKKEIYSIIKLEDLAKLVSHVQPSFKDLDSPEDDPVIVVDDSDEDEDDEVHATENVETEDTSVPKSSSPRSSQIHGLTNQVLILQSQNHKLKLKKNKAEAEAALLKAQPFFPNVEQLNELLVKSSKIKSLNILFAYDFSSSLLTELKN